MTTGMTKGDVNRLLDRICDLSEQLEGYKHVEERACETCEKWDVEKWDVETHTRNTKLLEAAESKVAEAMEPAKEMTE